MDHTPPGHWFAKWLVFDQMSTRLFAVGDNLVGLRLTERVPVSSDPIRVEKLEVEVSYR